MVHKELTALYEYLLNQQSHGVCELDWIKAGEKEERQNTLVDGKGKGKAVEESGGDDEDSDNIVDSEDKTMSRGVENGNIARNVDVEMRDSHSGPSPNPRAAGSQKMENHLIKKPRLSSSLTRRHTRYVILHIIYPTSS
jgi:hypothetical protein